MRPHAPTKSFVALDDGDLFGGEVVELVDELVDLAVGGLDLALEAFFFVGEAGGGELGLEAGD